MDNLNNGKGTAGQFLTNDYTLYKSDKQSGEFKCTFKGYEEQSKEICSFFNLR